MVTIGIPVYNCPKHLILQCLDSVINQTINNIEILIVNDCCTDDTMKYVSEKIMEYSNDKNIRIVNHEKNIGIGGARNTIIRDCRKYLSIFITD